ncbi:unnamed protein product [Calypogeia fissa]
MANTPEGDANKEARKTSLTLAPSSQEARFFIESLKDWYDRPRAVSYTIGGPQPNARRRGSWHPGATAADIKGKAVVVQPFLVPTLPEDAPAAPVSEMKDRLLTVNKDELVDLVLQYYNELVGLGRTMEANRLLESAVKHVELPRQIADAVQTADTGIDKLLKDGLLQFLLKLNKFLPPLPPQVIKFKDISYYTMVLPAQEGYETVGSMVLRCLMPCLAAKKTPTKFSILEDCTGYLMPGTLTLVCGPPGCGKSSLHKAIAGRLLLNKTTFLNSKVTYNGKGLDEIQPRRVAAFIGQTDRHLPALTVRETVEFAYKCASLFPAESKKGTEAMKMVEELGGTDLPLELTLHLLGLRGVADNKVGSATVRGISGGERHRVTTAEMIVGTYGVFLLDEISTGLDSSATFDIVQALRISSRIRQTTCLLSLLQPSPEVFDLFDRLIVLHEGCIIYQGPTKDVVPYFAELGYVKPKHVDVADFLQEVTTPGGLQFLQSGYTPLTTDGFVEAYVNSDLHRDVLRIVNSTKNVQELWVESPKPLGLKLRDKAITRPGDKTSVEVFEVEERGALATPSIQQTTKVKPGDIITGVLGSNSRIEYVAGIPEGDFVAEEVVNKVGETQGTVRLQLERGLLEGKNSRSLFEKEYVEDWKASAKTVFARQTKLTLRNTSFLIARNLQVLIIAVFTGTLFYRVSPSHQQASMDLKKSLAFLACMALSLNTVAQIPQQLDVRQVVEKQFAARFYRTQIYVLASALNGIPYTALETLIYCPLLYWLTGLSSAQGGIHFIMYIFIVFTSALAGAALVRLIVSVSGSREGATGLAGISIIIFLLFAGFLITRNKVPHWWIWAYYISPLQWGVTALVCNEFLSGEYNQPCSTDLVYCVPHMDLKVGQAYLELYGFPTTFLRGVWVPVIILALYYVFFTLLTFYTTSKLRHEEVKLPSAARLLAAKMRMLEGQQSIEVVSLPNRPKAEDLSRMERGNGGDAESGRAKTDNTIVNKFVPMILSFHQLTYEVIVPGVKDPRLLLAGVSAYAKPGTLTALMGSSGAGKTTLLDVLAGRKTIGRMAGEILVNGYPKEQATFARISGYVEQNDIHTPFITVRESLHFSAALRLPRSSNRDQFVKEVTKVLELEEIASKLVGKIGDSGLSVEEAKRLTIGVELVANPSILFLDEPTSGLDSRAAQIVMRSIKSIVATGRTVICTIHQPSRRLFLAFDYLLLLKRGGRIVYFGPIGQDAVDMLAYFQSLPGVQECGENQNPASYMLEIIGAGIGHSTEWDFALDYQQSSLNQNNGEILETYRFGKGKLGAQPTVKGYAATWHLMFVTVVTRQYKTYWRNIAYSFGRMMMAIILSLLLGSAFWQIKYDTIPGMATRMGLIYLSIVFIAITNANNVIPQVNLERPVYYRERASNMYSLFLYILSWTLAEIPYLCISTLIFCAICFSMAGVATSEVKQFFQYWFIFFEYAASITFFGIFVAMLTPNAETATIIIPIIINFWNMTSGFMIPRNQIPNFWIWLYWCNPTMYALNSLTSIAFYCDTDNPPCNTCTTSLTSCPGCTCVRLKEENNMLTWTVLTLSRSLRYDYRTRDMCVLFGFILAFSLMGVLALKYMRFDKR